MIILATILFIAVLVVDLWIDYDKWDDFIPINHNKKWERGVALIPCLALFAWQLPGNLFFSLPYSWAMIGFTYWTLFDGIFNLMRREKWNFNESDETDAKLDKFQYKVKWFWIAKIIISAGLIGCYIKMML